MATTTKQTCTECTEIANVSTDCKQWACPKCGRINKMKSNRLTRKQKDQIYKDLGMTRVRGTLGGIYYE